MKSSRNTLSRSIAVPHHYHAFFSFPQIKGGYSGVAVYTDTRTITPLKAEEGLSGILQPKPPLSPDERISRSYPCIHQMQLMPDNGQHGSTSTPTDLTSLDAEGRALVIDFGLFVLINVYCPNQTSDARLPYKMNFHFMLQERVRILINEGREVVVVGDINICATPLDHCDGHLPSNAATFNHHPARAWFNDWLSPIGSMTDTVRSFWPARKGMYTCWNSKISARESNYGTRVDYILVTPGIIPWIKHGDIQPSLKGSDHCPIYIDLHDQITSHTGHSISLSDVLPMIVRNNTNNNNNSPDPPRLAAQLWEEYSGKQTLLSTFFAKGNKTTVSTNNSNPNSLSLPSSVSPTPPAEHPPVAAHPDHTLTRPTVDLPPSLSSQKKAACTSMSQPLAPTSKPKPHPNPNLIPSASSSSSSSSTKRKSTSSSTIKTSKKQKLDQKKGGQSKLSTFFGQSPDADAPLCSQHDDDPSPQDADADANADQANHLDSDYQFAIELSASFENQIPYSCSQTKTKTARSWSHLMAMAPIQPPRCTIHNEPTKEYTVNKPGPNKGKTFFLCSRPVGPGYDKGKTERLREEVDHRYRCNFFKWSSDVRRELEVLVNDDENKGVDERCTL